MSQPQQQQQQIILSDSDSGSDSKPQRRRLPETDTIDLITPPPPFPKKKKLSPNPTDPTPVFLLDDDDDPSPITNHKTFSTPSFVADTPLFSNNSPPFVNRSFSMGPASNPTPSFVEETPLFVNDSPFVRRSFHEGRASDPTPSFVAETPLFPDDDVSVGKCSVRKCGTAADAPVSELFLSDASPTAKCKTGGPESEPAFPLISTHNSPEDNRYILLDSDNESERIDGFGVQDNNNTSYFLDAGTSTEMQEQLFMGITNETHGLEGCSPSPSFLDDEMSQNCSQNDNIANKESIPTTRKPNSGGLTKNKTTDDEAMKPKRMSKEERLRMNEEKKQQKEREKLLKAASKAEAAEVKKREKEMQKVNNAFKGKNALKAIVAEIDKKVIEMGTIGGHLVNMLREKGLSFRVTSNAIEGSIIWNMAVPDENLVMPSEGKEIPYISIIYEAEKFCNDVVDGSFMNHVQNVQHRYPHHTICYITNRLMWYVNKRENAQFKNPAKCTDWQRPALDEVFSKLATHFLRVHSRHCVDESELAEHVVGLTCSLASCKSRKKPTRLSVNANGNVIPKDCVDKNLIKKNLWLKALVAIPKVQPRFAVAIWKKYPTMRSLLTVYMDPTKSVHEKEFLLKELNMEGLFGDDRRLGEVCSKRIYRVLMAQSGNILTDQVENGADFFKHQC